MDDLEKIDIIRERTGVGYKEARELLVEARGDVVQALVLAEEREEQRRSSWEVRGKELVDKVLQLLHEGNVTSIRILHGGKQIFVIPVTAGVIGTLLAPKLALLAAAACLFTRCRIEVQREEEEGVNG